MDDFFTSEERKEAFSLYRHLLQSAGDTIFWRDCQKLKKHLIKAAQCNGLQRNNFGMNPVIRDLQTAVIVAEEIGMKGSCLVGIMLHEIVKAHIPVYRRSECRIWRRYRQYHQRTGENKRTVLQKSGDRIGEFPQSAALFCPKICASS